MSRKTRTTRASHLTIVSADNASSALTQLKPFTSRFGGNLQTHLQLYQRFIGQWIWVMQSWAETIDYPIQCAPGTHEIYGEVMGSLQRYTTRLFSLTFNRAQQQNYADILDHHGDNPVAKLGREALLREDALTSAFALLDVVVAAVNDCFIFGTILGGGPNAEARFEFLGSELLPTLTEAYYSGLETVLSAGGSPKVTLGKGKDPRARATAEREIIETIRKPMTVRFITERLGLANHLFMSSLQLLSAEIPQSPIEFIRAAPPHLVKMDEALSTTEVFVVALDGFIQALRQMNERDLADILEEISELLC